MRLDPIETARLLIRPFVQDDWEGVFAYMSDPVVTAYLPEGRLGEAGARAFVEANTGEQPENYALLLKPQGRLIGHMIFHPWFAHRTYEIGWVLGRLHHNQGYATEAAKALLAHGFEQMDLHRVIATCQPENIASYRVMEKLGMRREAHFRQCIYRGEGLWWDEFFYAIKADEWRPGPRK